MEVYLLDKEKQRLETELSMLVKRQKRIEGRLSEVGQAMQELLPRTSPEGELPARLVGEPGDGAKQRNTRGLRHSATMPMGY